MHFENLRMKQNETKSSLLFDSSPVHHPFCLFSGYLFLLNVCGCSCVHLCFADKNSHLSPTTYGCAPMGFDKMCGLLRDAAVSSSQARVSSHSTLNHTATDNIHGKHGAMRRRRKRGRSEEHAGLIRSSNRNLNMTGKNMAGEERSNENSESRSC